MQTHEIIDSLWNEIKSNKVAYGASEDLFEMLRIYEETDKRDAHWHSKKLRNWLQRQIKYVLSPDVMDTNTGIKLNELYKRALLFDSHDDFDAYLIFLEFNRDPHLKFYLPRRLQLRDLVQGLQDLEDDVLDILSISMPPGTGKTTLGIFFLTWIMGKYPSQPNIASAHAGSLTRSIYDGVLKVLKDEEYLWREVFPNVVLEGTNAKDETINLGESKRFKTLTCRSIEGTLTGSTRCERYLYCDDLVSGIEEALNLDRLDTKQYKYSNDLKTRKKLGCKEIHIATRWSIHDIIGRLERQYENNPRARFLYIPGLNDNDESNFNYTYGVGFDTAYFKDLEETMDDVSFKCLIQQQPIEREGLLFPDEELRTYNGVLPEGEPDMILSPCDVAWGGGDSLSQPFGYLYGDTIYLPDWIFNKGDKTITRPIVIGKLELHRPTKTEFEADNGGHEYSDIVDEKLKEKGVRLNITNKKAPSKTSKMSRIIKAAPEIKEIVFLEKKLRSKEYARAMKELTSFNQNGKNKNDDSPDSLAMLVSMVTSRRYGKAEGIRRPC